jgi:hypothetical protein
MPHPHIEIVELKFIYRHEQSIRIAPGVGQKFHENFPNDVTSPPTYITADSASKWHGRYRANETSS